MADSKDLDETRRLLYMGLCADIKRYNLAGTLINALRHHYGVNDKFLELIEGDQEHVEDSDIWARGLIEKITAELDAG